MSDKERGSPRILFVVNVAWFFLSHRLSVARAARDAGYEVHLVTDIEDDSEEQAVRREGIIFHRARLARGSLNPISDLKYLLRLVSVMRMVAPDLVHNVSLKPVLYGTVAARLLRVRAIINAISGLGYSFTDESRRVLAYSLRWICRLLFHSPRVHLIFQNMDDERQLLTNPASCKGRVVLIRGSGVDLQAYRAVAEGPHRTTVLMPARILRDKGIREFIAAARLLQERGCVARFIIAGALDPSNPAAINMTDLQALVRGAPVECLGHVDDMPALLRESHIVCLPSYREGLPKALIESCAAGRPIVTTDVPGCRDVVTHGLNGLLVAPRDPVGLANALRRLIEDPVLRFELGQAGRRRAEQEFNLASVIQATLALYRVALDRIP